LLKVITNPIHSFADENPLHEIHYYSTQNTEVREMERNTVLSAMNEDLCRIME